MGRKRMVYEWGKRAYAVDPQVVGDTVTQIEKREGCCAPSRLVETARDETSPLHPLFTWDDAEAADHWRTHEARQVINSLSVTVKVDGREEHAPAFISVGHTTATQAGGEGYRSFAVVVETPDLANEAINEVVARLEALQRRYGTITKLSPVWQALAEVKAA